MDLMLNDIKIQQPPRTALEVFEMLPEGTLAEVIDNTIYMPPPPSVHHQHISMDLGSTIWNFVKEKGLGMCLAAPAGVYLDGNNVVEPDLLFISNSNLGIIKDGKVCGAPDLIIEILSTNRKYDLETKKNLYEAFGVKEYFIVDQTTKDVITYCHDGVKYMRQKSEKGKIDSRLLGRVFEF